MNKPVRLQLSRRKGFNLKRLSERTNGLRCFRCIRPGRWSNPFRVGIEAKTAAEAFAMFRAALPRLMIERGLHGRIGEIRNVNLACWCKPGNPCHADVLLELANK